MQDERGSATIWMLALVPMLAFALFFALGIAQLAITRSNAATAADMSALAGAAHVDQACEWSQRIARQNRAELTTCEVRGEDVHVEVAVAAPPLFSPFGLRALRAAALAGPQDSLE